MKNYTAKELLDILNHQDECEWIEAKGGNNSSRSVMETVCSYSNEPGLDGGFILLGVAQDDSQLFSQYKTIHIDDPDKFQRDFISQCSSMFNISVRPKVSVEEVNGDTIIKVLVNELPQSQKPIYFKSDGLPSGAYRRIGSTDQKCTEDDMHIFYTDYKSYDQTPIKNTNLADIDENALNRYKTLREKINPIAEELAYNNEELLEALGCVNKENKQELNLAGLLLFGSSKVLRSHFPMLRVDYIRVPGNQWVEDPDNRFTTIDMRGPLMLLIYRLIDAINADLPKGFLLGENQIQANSTGLPLKALREAIVNALMHRSYREHRPIQLIRYDNRIEIINPGYSLKSEELLGQPGSETRNPFIAAVFHETNLAETKGSGIRAMRRLMEQAQLVPPTFESDRTKNQFVSRLLLHHFLGENDLEWLKQFEGYNLNNYQKQALIFVREVGAIDNYTYRQMSDTDVVRASVELRHLKSLGFFKSKGKGKATYYIAGKLLNSDDLSTPVNDLSTPAKKLNTPASAFNTSVQHTNTSPRNRLPNELIQKIDDLGKRVNDKSIIKNIIIEICKEGVYKSKEIAEIVGKREDYIKRSFLSELINEGRLIYLHPEMINHPEQAYTAAKD